MMIFGDSGEPCAVTTLSCFGSITRKSNEKVSAVVCDLLQKYSKVAPCRTCYYFNRLLKCVSYATMLPPLTDIHSAGRPHHFVLQTKVLWKIRQAMLPLNFLSKAILASCFTTMFWMDNNRFLSRSLFASLFHPIFCHLFCIEPGQSQMRSTSLPKPRYGYHRAFPGSGSKRLVGSRNLFNHPQTLVIGPAKTPNPVPQFKLFFLYRI